MRKWRAATESILQPNDPSDRVNLNIPFYQTFTHVRESFVITGLRPGDSEPLEDRLSDPGLAAGSRRVQIPL